LKNIPPKYPFDSKLIHLLHTTKQFCKNNQNIIFTRADKSDITVAMDKSFYTKKIEELLKDDNTYIVVKRNPAKSIENNLNNILKKWFQKEFVSKQ